LIAVVAGTTGGNQVTVAKCILLTASCRFLNSSPLIEKRLQPEDNRGIQS
jgi:hypothetical protein